MISSGLTDYPNMLKALIINQKYPELFERFGYTIQTDKAKIYFDNMFGHLDHPSYKKNVSILINFINSELIQNNFLHIVGPGGTGKTFLIRILENILNYKFIINKKYIPGYGPNGFYQSFDIMVSSLLNEERCIFVNIEELGFDALKFIESKLITNIKNFKCIVTTLVNLQSTKNFKVINLNTPLRSRIIDIDDEFIKQVISYLLQYN
jgi:DNA replication protein DnaC